MRSPMVLALTGMLVAPGVAAECACLCVDGGWQTVCSSPGEMGVTGDLCHLRPSGGVCPVPPAGIERRTYAAPVPGAGNCRDVQVYDPGSGDFVGARVCDMRPGG